MSELGSDTPEDEEDIVPATPTQDTPENSVQPGLLPLKNMEINEQIPNVLDDDLLAGSGIDKASQPKNSRSRKRQKSTESEEELCDSANSTGSTRTISKLTRPSENLKQLRSFPSNSLLSNKGIKTKF